MLLITFLIAAVASTLATALLNPFRHTRRLDAAVVAAVFALPGLAALIAGFVLADTVANRAAQGLVALFPGIVLAVATLVQRRRLHWQVESVFHPRFSESRLASLQAHLAKKKMLPRTQDARRAAWVFGERAQFEVAEALLSALPLDTLPRVWRNERALVLNDLAAYRLRLGDLDGARHALSKADGIPGTLAGPLGTKRALLAAVEGDGDAALAILEGVKLPDTSPHHLTAHLATAHAQAERGDLDAARAALLRLIETDPDWLVRTSTPAGPATALAAALAAEKDAPYR
ncbi:MAG: tetratricopeptide repeat protein [Sandaracinaceae bacterium]